MNLLFCILFPALNGGLWMRGINRSQPIVNYNYFSESCQAKSDKGSKIIVI